MTTPTATLTDREKRIAAWITLGVPAATIPVAMWLDSSGVVGTTTATFIPLATLTAIFGVGRVVENEILKRRAGGDTS